MPLHPHNSNGEYSDSLANLSVYNMNIIDPESVSSGSISGTVRSRPASAHLDSKQTRPVSGKRGRVSRPPRPLSAKQLQGPEAKNISESAANRELLVSGVTACQPYVYYEEPPVGRCQDRSGKETADPRYVHTITSSHTNEEAYYPIVPCCSPVPLQTGEEQSQYFVNNYNQSTSSIGNYNQSSSGMGNYNQWQDENCMNTVFEDDMTKPSLAMPSKNQSSHFSRNGREYIQSDAATPYKHMLTLELPDTNYSADVEEEIPTLRLLDDLHIDLTAGKVSVTVTPELRARLANTHLSSDVSTVQRSTRDDVVLPGGVHTHPCYSSRAETPKAMYVDQQKTNMEKELRSLFSQKSSANHRPSTGSPMRVSQSIDCWAPAGSSPDDEVSEGSSSKLSADDQTMETELNGSHPSQIAGDGRTVVGKDKHSDVEQGKQEVKESSRMKRRPVCDSSSSSTMPSSSTTHCTMAELPANHYTEIVKEETSKVKEERKEEELLYRWNIDVSKSKQIPDIEVPLLNKRRDYEALDEEIDERVEEIERQLALQIAESQKTIERLQAEANTTEFTIPQFCELNQNSADPTAAETGGGDFQPQGLESSVKGRTEFSVLKHDYNVAQQAKKYGLKNRDVSNVWEAVTPRYRKKYTPSSAGMANVKNVASRVNSGIKSRRTKMATKQDTAGDKNTDERRQLVITPAAVGGAVQSQPNPISAEAAKVNPTKKQRHVTFSTTTNHKIHKAEKVIKTLSLAEGCGEVVEDKQVATFVPVKSQVLPYEVPAEVKKHLEKCASRPPSRPPSRSKLFNGKVETAAGQESQSKRRQPRIQSAPVIRKLNRERSFERKLSNGFVNIVKDVKSENAPSANVMAGQPTIAHQTSNSSVTNGHSPHDAVKQATSSGQSLSQNENQDEMRSQSQLSSKLREHIDDDVTTAMTLIDDNDSLGTETTSSYQGGLAGNTSQCRPASAHIMASKGGANKKHNSGKPSRRVQSAPVRRRVTHRSAPTDTTNVRKHIQREDPDEIEQIEQVYDRVMHLGVDLNKSTLDRSLFPPASQPVSVCQKEMGKHLYTAGLLSSPEKWLKAEYRKLKEAQGQVRRCERLLQKEKANPAC